MLQKMGKSQREREVVKVASVAAFNPDGLLLFGQRNDSGLWTLPGGHFEPNEEPVEAARRELEEETGLKGENFEFLGVGEVETEEGELHIYCFRCLAVGDPNGAGDPDEECSEWRWVEPNDVPAEVMENLHSKKNITLRLLGIQEGDVEDPLEKKDIEARRPIPVQHYSTTPGLKELDPKFQGTGAAGAERNRSKRIPRTYYYTRPGTPESIVSSGAHLYHGELPKGTRLYDMGEDSLQLRTPSWKQTKFGMEYQVPDLDAVEKKLAKLGYHGYHNYGVKDALAYFHPLPVKHIVGQGFQKSDPPTVTLPLEKLVVSHDSLLDAYSNVTRSKGSHTPGPVNVWVTEHGEHLLVDGHHRLVQHLLSGKHGGSIPAHIIGSGYTDYWRTAPANERAQLDSKLKYGGVEHLTNKLGLRDAKKFGQILKSGDDLQKGFLATAALAGAMVMGGAAPSSEPHVPEQHQSAVTQAPSPPWTPEELHPDLIPIAHLESSFGQNMAHASHPNGEFHTAFGALGFKPLTAHEEYTKSKFMNKKYPGLSSPEDFLSKFKSDPKFYNLLASAHFARLKARHGDAQKAAYAWRWGSTACANAADEQIKNDGYVQKYTAMQLQGLQGQPKIQKNDDGPIDTSFDFGANDPERDLLHQKALKSIARMHPDNRKMAQDWLDFCRGKVAERPFVHPDMERHLARFGIVDPAGFHYQENGRSMERKLATRRASGRKGPIQQQPEGLRQYRGLDRDYFSPYKKSEDGGDPIEAMLHHENPRERMLALRSHHVTPYHLRLALDDEAPEVRELAASHPKMTPHLIFEALHHEDPFTRKVALRRPDLTPELIQSVLFDPDLQKLAAQHPKATPQQVAMVADHHLTPPKLKSSLLAKTVGYLKYPRLGQTQVDNTPLVREPEAHRKLAELSGFKNPQANLGFTTASKLREPTPPSARWTSMSVKGGRDPKSVLTSVSHETQHGIFSHLKQVYGKDATHRIIASTLISLAPEEHEHLKRLTDWSLKNYSPLLHPEERIAYLQNYLLDAQWRNKAHKSMGILGNRKAERESHGAAKRIWQKLRLRAENLTPQEVGVILKTEEERLEDWVELKKHEIQVEQIVKSQVDVSYNDYEDQLGMRSKFDDFLQAAKFLAHAEPDPVAFRQVLILRGGLAEAALASVGLPSDAQNKKALLAVVALREKPGQKERVAKNEKEHRVQPLMSDGDEVARSVQDGFNANTHQQLRLDGRHSAGTLLVRDPNSGAMFLLKPGSGGQSPAKGAREEGASQSRREASFWRLAKLFGLQNRVPRADLLLIDGQEVAALHLLPFSWRNLEKLKFIDVGLPHKALEKYRQTGELHKWAVLDFIAGNPDRHGQNLMVGPEKDGYPVALIDHGSAFAGDSFDPANDKNSFLPYYLRAWKADSWNELTMDQKLRFMPVVGRDTDSQLRTWLESIHAGEIESILASYGIDPAPTLRRLTLAKRLLTLGGSLSQAINRLWLVT